jgi:hypothetical protein
MRFSRLYAARCSGHLAAHLRDAQIEPFQSPLRGEVFGTAPNSSPLFSDISRAILADRAKSLEGSTICGAIDSGRFANNLFSIIELPVPCRPHLPVS